jgi:hypothetical protein
MPINEALSAVESAVIESADTLRRLCHGAKYAAPGPFKALADLIAEYRHLVELAGRCDECVVCSYCKSIGPMSQYLCDPQPQWASSPERSEKR